MWTELPVSHNEYIPYKNAVFSESQVLFGMEIPVGSCLRTSGGHVFGPPTIAEGWPLMYGPEHFPVLIHRKPDVGVGLIYKFIVITI